MDAIVYLENTLYVELEPEQEDMGQEELTKALRQKIWQKIQGLKPEDLQLNIERE